MSRDETASVLGALVLGGIIGATLGVLFAPAKGEATRKAIKKEATRISKEAEKEARDFVSDKIEPAYEDVKGKFEDARDDVKEKFEDARGDVDKYVDGKKKQLASKLSN